MAPQFRALSSRRSILFQLRRAARKEIEPTKKFSTQPPAAKQSFSLMRRFAYTYGESGKLSMVLKKCLAFAFWSFVHDHK
jgi:hypothetical protein